MLAATAMTAMLAGALYASLHVAFNAKNSALRAVEPVRKCQAVFDIIKQDLQSAMIPKGVLAGAFVGNKPGGVFSLNLQGNQGELLLSFYTASTEDAQVDTGVGDVKKVEYVCQLSADSNGNAIVRQVTTNLLAPVAVEPNQEMICQGVGTLTFRYFDGTTWNDSWDSTTLGDILPTAVEVTIELAPPTSGGPATASARQAGQNQAGYTETAVILIPCGQSVSDTSSSGTSSSATP